MKKGFKILCIAVIATFMTTGCVKMEISMNINKDKSMDLSVTEAVVKAMMETSNEEMFSEEELQEVKDDGFSVEEYSDNNMVGYTFTKSITNIDTVSSEKEVVGDLGVGENSSEDNNLFTVKKGLFKNTYTAKLISSDTESVSEQMDEATTEGDSDDTDFTTDESTELTDDSSEEATDDTYDTSMDYLNNMSSMEMNFKVTLPYKAISNNATETTDDGKTLTWNLLESEDENMEFEFELYNMTNIYIAAGIALVIIIALIVFIISKLKKKKNGKGTGVQSEAPVQPAVAPKPAEPVQPAVAPKPAEPVQPAAPKPAEPVQPAVAPKPAEPVNTNPNDSQTEIVDIFNVTLEDPKQDK